MSIKNYLTLGFLLFISSSLFSQVKSSSGKSYDIHQNDAKIQFLTFQYEENASLDNITLIDSKVRNGKLKVDFDCSLRKHDDDEYILFSLLDKQGKIIRTEKIPDPKVSSIHYPKEDMKSMGEIEIEEESVVFVIRIPFNANLASIQFESQKSSKGAKHIINILLSKN